MTSTDQHAKLPVTIFAGLVAGASYPLRGLRVLTQSGLWPKALLPVAVNALLLLALWGAAFGVGLPWGIDLIEGASAWFGGADWWLSLWAGIKWLVVGSMVLLLLAVGALLVLVAGRVVAGPFLDVLAQAIERDRLGVAVGDAGLAAGVRGAAVAVMDGVWAVVLLLAIDLPLIVLGWVLGPIAVALATLISALYLAHEFVGLPLARGAASYRLRWRLVRTHWPLCIGFGAAAAALMLVPGLNLVLLPMVAAGGTTLFCDLLRSENLGWIEDRHLGAKLAARRRAGFAQGSDTEALDRI